MRRGGGEGALGPHAMCAVVVRLMCDSPPTAVCEATLPPCRWVCPTRTSRGATLRAPMSRTMAPLPAAALHAHGEPTATRPGGLLMCASVTAAAARQVCAARSGAVSACRWCASS